MNEPTTLLRRAAVRRIPAARQRPHRVVAGPAGLRSVLVVSERITPVELLRHALRTRGADACELHRCASVSVSEIAPLAEAYKPDVILLDLSLREPTPLVAYAVVSATVPGVPIVLLSAAEKEGVAIRVVHQGAADYVLEKQANSTLLVRALAGAVQRADDARALREVHDRFDAFFTQAHDAVFIASAEGIILDANPAFRSLFGVAADDVPGMEMGRFFVDGEQLAGLASDLRTHGSTRESPVQLRSGDGTVLECRISATGRRDPAGRIIDYQGIIRDVSEEVQLQQERAEALFREQQMRHQAEATRLKLSQILESISDAFFTLDREWRFTHINHITEQATLRYMGVGRDDLLDRSFWDVLPEMRGTEFEAQYARALQSGQPARFEAYFEPLRAWFSVRAYPTSEGLAIFFHDVTEKKRTEQALTVSEAKFRQIADNIRETFWMFNADFTQTIYVNRAYEALWGRSVESLYEDARTLFEGIHPGDLERLLTVIAHARDGETNEIEYRVVRPDGSVRWAWSRGFPIFDKHGELYRVVGTTEDITERKQAQLELAAAEAHYRRLVETSPYAIFACDLESRFTELNPAAEEILGRPATELVGHCMTEIIAPEDRPAVHQRLDERLAAGWDVIDHEVHVIRPSGERRLIHVRSTVIRDGGEVVGTHGIVRDITDERAQEKILRRTERLASVGTLVGGVAHELNNPLHAIRNFADLMLVDKRNEDDQEALEIIRREADRAAKVVSDLRRLARQTQQDRSERDAVELNDVVRHVLKLRRYSLTTSNVVITEELADDLPPVWASRGEMEQVLLNLVVNAEQALAEKADDRRLTLRTRCTPRGAAVHVVDSGPGIPAEYMERIFDPFFTTKSPSEGTGLGLSLVHSIIAEHAGEMHVESELGVGTAFRVELPYAPEDAEPILAAYEEPVVAKRSLRVLVVDDEPSIRRVTDRYLEHLGHRVEVASEGAEALQRLAEGEYDVIVSDLRMPGLDGESLLHRLREQGTGMEDRVVFLTGDAASAQAARVGAAAGRPMLMKPLRMNDLARALDAVSEPPSDR